MLKISGAALALAIGMTAATMLVKWTGGSYAGTLAAAAAICAATSLTAAVVEPLTHGGINLLKLSGIAGLLTAWLVALTFATALWQGPWAIYVLGLVLTAKCAGAAIPLAVAHPVARAFSNSMR